jgi:hypothetical protein
MISVSGAGASLGIFDLTTRSYYFCLLYTEQPLLKVEAAIITKKQLHALRYIWKS